MELLVSLEFKIFEKWSLLILFVIITFLINLIDKKEKKFKVFIHRYGPH